MIPELGQFSLILALCMAIVQSFFPLVGAASGKHHWMQLAVPAARAQCLFVSIAFATLVHAFLSNDFSVAYVANNSSSALPTIYRATAVWGSHEGSLLLWALILTFWTVAVTIFSRSLTVVFTARVVGVMGTVSIGFLLFTLFASNPFARLFPVPRDGGDLNPLLQDPGFIIHPPMLYSGYVGFSVVFAFAIAALLGGQLDSSWARWSRPWTTIAWTFLTLGIAIGSWWAYYELGWGGWWFWDPVENASFMPWLAGTALIHSLAATEKRGAFRNWTVLLAICAFALSLLGTFLVRSGVLTSVHAFATDPIRGVFILGLLTIFIGGSLVLYTWRAPSMAKSSNFTAVSKETFLLINSICLTVAMASVLLGTIYPLISEALSMGKLSVGEPYFNTVFVPLMIPVALAIGVGVLARWRMDDLYRLWKHLRYVLIGSIVIGLLMITMVTEFIHFYSVLAVVLASWIVTTTCLAIHERMRYNGSVWLAIRKLPLSFVGMCIAHLGFAVVIIGISMSSYYSTESHERMGPGDKIELSNYIFELESITALQGPNYRANEGVFHVYNNNQQVASLHTQKRLYIVRGMPMTEAGIHSGLFRDLFVSLGEPLDNGDWSVRLYYKPFISWIWAGSLFMCLGGFIAALDRRYRLGGTS